MNHEQNVIGQNVHGHNATVDKKPMALYRLYLLGSLTSRELCAYYVPPGRGHDMCIR